GTPSLPIPGHGQSVWPKDLQYAFLQGLQAYWGSPYSTHTLGRSGIVQFIVHYLQGLGIGRKREQVASRMQVLRERMRNSVSARNHPVADKARLNENSVLSPINPQSLPKIGAIEIPLPPSYKYSFIGMEEVEDEGNAPPLPSLPWNSPYIFENESFFFFHNF
ncbi:hypothetical protein B0H14DRAFT_2715072, partial [Mycena olivaceomarginata]